MGSHAYQNVRLLTLDPGLSGSAPTKNWKQFLTPFSLVLLFFTLGDNALGQTVTTAITGTSGPGNLGTQVLLPSGNVYGIRGGQTVGSNLFHSFGQFSVATGDIAQFQTSTLVPNGAMSNILSRVTGGNPSAIFGAIDSASYYPGANLFLMNPAGVIFGPTATLNIGGMATFTTADYLKLEANGTSGVFHANPAMESILISAPVTAFGFLGSNPAAITVQGSQLTVAEGTGISLVGGNITVQSGTPDGSSLQQAALVASEGRINLVSVASAGETSAIDFSSSPGMTMGNINLSQGTLLDVSANAAGTIRIRGGQLVIADATLSADTANVNGAPTAVDIHVTGDISIADTRGVPAMTARTTGAGDAGTIQIVSGSFLVGSTSPEPTPFGLIDTHTSGSGKAGDIHITTGDLTASYQGSGLVQLIDSGTAGPGHGGNLTIVAHNMTLEGLGINTGDTLATILSESPSGSAGNVNITADRITLTNSTIDTSAITALDAAEQAGSVSLNASDITMAQSVVSGIGYGGGGGFSVTTHNLKMDNSRFESLTVSGPAGAINVQAAVAEMTNGSQLVTSTAGDGQAGDIHVMTTDHLTLATSPLSTNPSGLFSNSTGDLGGGNAGSIVVTTPTLDMTGGSRINTTTLSSGHGGNVTINSTNTISISGEFPSSEPEPIFGIGTVHPSGIFTKTAGQDLCSSVCGNAGNISITTGSFMLSGGAQIDSGTNNNGLGGTISVHAANAISLSGVTSEGAPVGIFSRTIGTTTDSGSGGNITLNAGQSVTISDGAAVSASTTGPGNAGNITIQGLASRAQSVVIDGTGSGVLTDTQGSGAGGNIFVNANSVTLQNGGNLSAKTSGTEPSATGGTITVQSNQIALQSDAVITSSTSGAGDAGMVTLLANESISLSNSTIASNSEPLFGSAIVGNGGQVTLTAPNITLEQGSALLAQTTGSGQAGAIEINSNALSLADKSVVRTSTFGPGPAGSITMQGLGGSGSKAQTVSLAGGSSLSSSSTGNDEGEGGPAGNITVGTRTLSLSGGSQITTSSMVSPGDAGAIVINAGESILLSQGILTSRSESNIPDEFVKGYVIGNAGSIVLSAPTVTLQNHSRIASTTDSRYTGDPLKGNAGSVTVNTANLSVTEGSIVTSSSVIGDSEQPPVGNAGTVIVQGLTSPAQSVLIDGAGSGIFTATQGSGAGGDITVSAQAVTVQNNAQVSSSSTGSGSAGNINLAAGNQLTMTNSSITTEATQSGGGIIKITTDPSGTVELTNSKISASVLDGTGGGGSVNIDPQFVILQNSQILAEAVQGPGGNINITITNGGLFLPDATSRVSASSQFGQSGTVTIQSPNAPAGGKIQPLGKAPLQVTALLSQRCAAIARGEVSSFVVAGRDTLPTEPGGWLTSPLASGSIEAGSAVQAYAPAMPTLSKGSTTISLRRMPSSRSLVQPIEDDWFAGCAS